MRKPRQPVGLTAHGREHHHEVVSGLPGLHDPFRHAVNPLYASDRGAAVFLNDEGHAQRQPRGRSLAISLVASRAPA